MKRLFISQPMSGLTKEQVMDVRKKMTDAFSEYLRENNENDECVRILDNWHHPRLTESSTPFEYLGEDLIILAQATDIILAPGYKESRGCRAEYYMICNYINDYHFRVLEYNEELGRLIRLTFDY